MATAGRTVVFSADDSGALDGRDGVVPDVLPQVVRLRRQSPPSRWARWPHWSSRPAAIVLLGDRLHAMDVRRLVRRLLQPATNRRANRRAARFWYRWTKTRDAARRC